MLVFEVRQEDVEVEFVEIGGGKIAGSVGRWSMFLEALRNLIGGQPIEGTTVLIEIAEECKAKLASWVLA